MSFIAFLLTFLFFCYPSLLAVAVVILIMVILCTIIPGGGFFVVAILVAGVALALMDQN